MNKFKDIRRLASMSFLAVEISFGITIKTWSDVLGQVSGVFGIIL